MSDREPFTFPKLLHFAAVRSKTAMEKGEKFKDIEIIIPFKDWLDLRCCPEFMATINLTRNDGLEYLYVNGISFRPEKYPGEKVPHE